MSEDNTIAQVANGTAPQPNTKVETNYQALQDEMEDAVDSGLESEDIDDLDSEVEDEGSPEEQIDAAAAKGDITKAQAQQLKKTLKIKVDGQEMEETLDFNDEESLKRYVQKAKAFDKKSNEFAQTKSQMDQLLKMLKESPEELMEKVLGYNLDDYAENRLAKRVEQLKKSPEQIERENMEKELAQLREEKLKASEEKKRLEEEKMRNEEASKIESEITMALNDVSSILPKNDPEIINEIARTMLLAMKKGHDGVTAKDVIPVVEKKWQDNLNRFFNGSSEEMLEKLVGKANLDRYRKKAIQSKREQTIKGQTTTAKQIVKDTGTQKQVQEEPKKTKKFKSIFDYT